MSSAVKHSTLIDMQTATSVGSLCLNLKRCSHCARHRTTPDGIVRCREQREHRFTANSLH